MVVLPMAEEGQLTGAEASAVLAVAAAEAVVLAVLAAAVLAVAVPVAAGNMFPENAAQLILPLRCIKYKKWIIIIIHSGLA